ncbi:amino acid transporter arg-13 [Drechmeria coniospora]|uniref:Amino acid transporter arg-13 n=1 Tax=Drechmeria coniospora TaxID=98403 RepID=A0A151GET1_DRECN|nr:amino acid transporter arg-13 [Drechmeria coniospora]KYK55595.1 amino acid transporter arg-13 [Drechmeria coniospora]
MTKCPDAAALAFALAPSPPLSRDPSVTRLVRPTRHSQRNPSLDKNRVTPAAQAEPFARCRPGPTETNHSALSTALLSRNAIARWGERVKPTTTTTTTTTVSLLFVLATPHPGWMTTFSEMEPSPVSVEATTSALTLRGKSALLEAVEDVFYGSVAGVVGKYIEYPFDTVKVRLQSQPDHLPLRYKGPLDCFRQSIQTEGFYSLYRGITAPLVGAALETSSLFVFESLGREVAFRTGLASRERSLSVPALWATGAFSGACTSFVLTPIELVKCKIQAPMLAESAAAPPVRPLAVIRDVYRHEGLRGFWHGQLGTLIRETGGCSAWFGAKETATAMFYNLKTSAAATEAERKSILSKPLPLWQQALAGASAGVSYNFLFFPADTVKSRMQTVPVGRLAAKRTFWNEGVALWRQHGLRGFYRGCGVTCLRSAPSSAFIFMVYDGLKRRFPLQ